MANNFKRWQKYQVLKKQRDLRKQANIYFKYTKQMLDEYKKMNGGQNEKQKWRWKMFHIVWIDMWK